MSTDDKMVKRRRSALRGRQLEPAVLSELRDLIGDERVDSSLRDRDRLIEHLHVLQDADGYLSMPRLRALAAFMNLPMGLTRARCAWSSRPAWGAARQHPWWPWDNIM